MRTKVIEVLPAVTAMTFAAGCSAWADQGNAAPINYMCQALSDLKGVCCWVGERLLRLSGNKGIGALTFHQESDIVGGTQMG